MSVSEKLLDHVDAWIAKKLWQKLLTELEAQHAAGKVLEDVEQFAWAKKRMRELLIKIGEKEGEKAKNSTSG